MELLLKEPSVRSFAQRDHSGGQYETASQGALGGLQEWTLVGSCSHALYIHGTLDKYSFHYVQQ
jgi:hypothetical protein